MSTFEGGTPSLSELIEAGAAGALTSVWTALPGKITEYDAAKQKASVQPLVSARLPDGSSKPLPIIPEVPVLFPSGSGVSLTWALAAGDTVLLIFCARSIAQWLGGGAYDAEPESPRQHSLTDAVAIPGLRPFGAALASPAASGVKISVGLDDGSAGMRIDGSNVLTLEAPASIKVGAGATKPPATAPEVAAELALISTAMGVLAAGLGGAPVPNPYPAPGAVAASKTLVE